MNVLLKLTCLLTGYNFNIVQGYDAWTKRKLSIFSIAILFPTVIGFLNGYLLTTQVMGGHSSTGLLVGFIIGTVIFYIERVIVMSTGTLVVGVFRLLLACVIATIGSFALKEVVFHKDIEKELANQRLQNIEGVKSKILLKYKPELNQLDTAISRYQQQYDDLMQRAKDEAVGKLSGRRGVDKITNFYLGEADKIQQRSLLPATAKKDSLLQIINHEVTQAQEADKDTDGILTKLNVFFSIMMKDPISKAIFWIFFLLFFLIEIMVFVLKACLLKSALEIDEENFRISHQFKNL